MHFNDARKHAQSTNVNLEREWNRNFIKKEKEFIRVLESQERTLDDIENEEMVDVLHKVPLLWKIGRKEEMRDVLVETRYGKKEPFYRVAQTISETLPMVSKEKKLLDGFLGTKDKLRDEIKNISRQKRLFE